MPLNEVGPRKLTTSEGTDTGNRLLLAQDWPNSLCVKGFRFIWLGLVAALDGYGVRACVYTRCACGCAHSHDGRILGGAASTPFEGAATLKTRQTHQVAIGSNREALGERNAQKHEKCGLYKIVRTSETCRLHLPSLGFAGSPPNCQTKDAMMNKIPMIGALAAGLMIAVLPPAVAVASPHAGGPGVSHNNPTPPGRRPVNPTPPARRPVTGPHTKPPTTQPDPRA
jgi:hypothetical protein